MVPFCPDGPLFTTTAMLLLATGPELLLELVDDDTPELLLVLLELVDDTPELEVPLELDVVELVGPADAGGLEDDPPPQPASTSAALRTSQI